MSEIIGDFSGLIWVAYVAGAISKICFLEFDNIIKIIKTLFVIVLIGVLLHIAMQEITEILFWCVAIFGIFWFVGDFFS